MQSLGLCKSCCVLPTTGMDSFTQGSAHASMQLEAKSFPVIMLSLRCCSCVDCCCLSRQCTGACVRYCNAHTSFNVVVLGAEDIADPKHPLRFHQFITNMKRPPPSPLPADPQDGPKPVPSPDAGPDASLSSQQAQPPHASSNQTLSDQSPVDHMSTSGVTPTGQPLTASLDQGAEAASGSASSGQRKADASPSIRSGSSDTSSSTTQSTGARVGSESGTFQSLCRDLADLVPPDDMSRTLSLGGPVPGGQVSGQPCLPPSDTCPCGVSFYERQGSALITSLCGS